MIEHEKANERYGSVGYQSAAGTAIVAGVFAAMIAVLLGIHLYHYHVTDPAGAVTLEKMKEQAKLYPADQTLSQEILTLDTQLRRDQLARLAFLKRGTLLLAGALAIGIGSLVWAMGYRSRLPSPSLPTDVKTEQIRTARRIRTALTAALAALAAGSLFWSLYTPTVRPPAEQGQKPETAVKEEPKPEAVFYVSMDQMEAQWPTFRGPGGLGVCRFGAIPTEWDAASGKNILWKTPVPLEGNSSPVVWDKRIFVTGAAEDRQTIFCYDAETGKLLWSGDVAVSDDPARAEMSIMEDTGYAACSPVTDGQRVCAIFAGGDIGCFTAEGRLLWQKPLGIPDSMYGYAASLTAFENLVIVQWDVGTETDQSKLIALDWQTGQTVWQTPRPVPNSWSSPTVVKIGDAYRILTAASPFVIAYDPRTGSELFRAECIEGDIAATPIFADGKIMTMQPYQKLVAIRTEDAAGDVTATHIAWQTEGAMPDICSPLSDGTLVWTLTSDGKLSSYKVSDGSEVYAQSLERMFQASPSWACGRLYLLSQDGMMIVAEAAAEYKEIGRNTLGEKCFASPACAEGRLYIRTKEHLYGIGTK